MDFNTKIISFITLILLLISTYIVLSNVFYNKYTICKPRKEN